MKAPNETLRIADQAVYDWLGGLRLDYGDEVFPGRDLRNVPVFRVFATPERAFAEIRQLLIHQGFISAASTENEGVAGASDDVLYKNIPYPFIRIQRGDISPVTELHSTPNTFLTDSKGLSFTRSRWPTPYEVSYTVEAVSKARFSDNYIAEWMIGQFTPVGMGVNQRLIPALFPEPYGVKQLAANFTGASDASELEVSGAVDRKIRTTYSITLRVWDVDLSGKSVKAIMSFRRETRSLADASLAVGDFGTLWETSAGRPLRVYNVKPVPERHSSEHTTAGLATKYHNEAQPYIIDSDTDAVETAGIPFLAEDAMQGAIRVQWRRVDGVKPAGSLRAQVLWRDSDNDFAPTVQYEVSLPYADAGATLDYQSLPGAPNREVSIRFLRPASGPSLIVGMLEQTVYRVPVTNIVDSGDRTQGPGLTASTDVLVSDPAIVRAEPYLVRAYVQVGTQPVTISVYTDALATELVATRVFTTSAEFTAYLSATNSQLFLVRITTPVADAALQVTGITVCRCRPRPLFAP